MSARLPILPLAFGGVLVIGIVGMAVLYRVGSSTSGPAGQPVANVYCDEGEQLAAHYHVHLGIVNKGQPVKVPANIGIRPSCLYWLHTHDDSGVIHIEAPEGQVNRRFTLADFFEVWGQPLSSEQVSTINLRSGDQLKVWVDGQPYSGDPTGIVLSSREQIVLEIGPPLDLSPPHFTWGPDL
jgi:hypothetical protein